MNDAAKPPPEPSDGPVTNAAQLKAAIDAGRTGDKAAASDPAAAPLGTDEEAAGTPPRPWDDRPGLRGRARRLGRAAQSPELTRNAERTPGVGLGVMVGVVWPSSLAAVLAWVVMGQSGVS